MGGDEKGTGKRRPLTDEQRWRIRSARPATKYAVRESGARRVAVTLPKVKCLEVASHGMTGSGPRLAEK